SIRAHPRAVSTRGKNARSEIAGRLKSRRERYFQRRRRGRHSEGARLWSKTQPQRGRPTFNRSSAGRLNSRVLSVPLRSLRVLRVSAFKYIIRLPTRSPSKSALPCSYVARPGEKRGGNQQ